MCVWTAFSSDMSKTKWTEMVSPSIIHRPLISFFSHSAVDRQAATWMNERADRKLISWNVKTIAKLNCDKLLTTCFNVRTRVKCAASVSEGTLVCHSHVDYCWGLFPHSSFSGSFTSGNLWFIWYHDEFHWMLQLLKAFLFPTSRSSPSPSHSKKKTNDSFTPLVDMNEM